MFCLIRIFFIITLLYLSVLLSGQSVCLNEVMSANLFTLSDEDGESEDWIELYNYGSTAINLSGYGLSDNADEPLKWAFPDITLPASGFLTVFASGKDRAFHAHWQTMIDWGDEWRYFVGTQEPPTAWRELDFNDNNWETGPSGFGDGDGDDATEINEIGQDLAYSVYIRKTFEIDDVNEVLSGLLHIDFDDAFVVWLNETEIARENIGYIGSFPAFMDSVDIRSHEAEIYQGGKPNHYIIADIQTILQNGTNVITIQTNTLDTDLTMIPILTLGYATPPADSLYVNSYAEPNLLNLHTNFSLNENESVILADPDGNIVDEVTPGYIPLDFSYGCQPDGTQNHFYFETPTPEITNNEVTAALYFADAPQFYWEGGVYPYSLNLSFQNIGYGETIYYTLDGSEPNPDSTDTYVYNNPVSINETTVVRALTVKDGFLPSSIVTNTYFIDDAHTLPVISLTTDPHNLWDYYEGIYVKGPNADGSFPYLRANFWQDWEKPVHLELYESDGTLGFEMDGGLKIFGYFSRGHDQKSLAFFARRQYGSEEIPYQFFPEKPATSYESIIFRNSGGDWMKSMMRDGFMQNLLQKTNLSYQAYRPAIIYINGVYWGIQNMREKINEHFFAQNYGADPDNIDMLEENRQVLYGDIDAYDQFMNFVDTHDLSIPANYAQICTRMDVENYISYQAAQILFCNTDWPGRNIKYWREKTADAKWRWQIFDLDLGLGLTNLASHNTLAFALRENGPYYPNPDWSTYLFRKLCRNETFVQKLCNRFADYLNTFMEPTYLEAAIDSNFAYLQPEMERHFERWNESYSDWENEHLVMAYFARDRKSYMTQYIMEQFDIPNTFQLNTRILPEEGGTILVNSVEIKDMEWSGDYFDHIPITVTAIPQPGYAFAGWTGDSASSSLSLTIDTEYDVYLEANFTKGNASTSALVINEINYNSAEGFDSGDWIELYNPGDSLVSLSPIHFKDDDEAHDFSPSETVSIEPKGYFVFCRDIPAFSALYPSVQNYTGEFDFGLSSNGDLVRIYRNDVLLDSLYFGVSSPWPTEPNGNGSTLALKNPFLDNSLAANWAASAEHGTPGAKNEDVYQSLNPPLSDKLVLSQNYPNPFTENTVIEYSIPTAGRVKLNIYNLKGQLVEKLVNEVKDEGTYSEIWTGKSRYDRQVSSGIYFCRITHDGKSKTRKMLLVR
ncbi:MAG TPA: CotH kinase family protein [Candidatus Cloacimonadota bacterium]|nr:CotH kinase family protein [Candidatus Cloacimonadota bacterium]